MLDWAFNTFFPLLFLTLSTFRLGLEGLESWELERETDDFLDLSNFLDISLFRYDSLPLRVEKDISLELLSWFSILSGNEYSNILAAGHWDRIATP